MLYRVHTGMGNGSLSLLLRHIDWWWPMLLVLVGLVQWPVVILLYANLPLQFFRLSALVVTLSVPIASMRARISLLSDFFAILAPHRSVVSSKTKAKVPLERES